MRICVRAMGPVRVVAVCCRLVAPGCSTEADLEQLLELFSGESFGLVLLVLDKVVAKTIIILVDDHSPNDENVGSPEDGRGALLVLLNVLFVQLLVAGPVHTAILYVKK